MDIIDQQIEANLRRQIEILEETVALQKKQLEAAFSHELSDSEIEQLSQQEPLPEGWTEYSEHETAFQKVKRQMKEQD